MPKETNQGRKENIILRLNRMKGQIRGIRKMIEEERPCDDVLAQVAAVRGAMNSLSVQIAETYLRGCLLEKLEEKLSEDTVERFVSVYRRLQG